MPERLREVDVQAVGLVQVSLDKVADLPEPWKAHARLRRFFRLVFVPLADPGIRVVRAASARVGVTVGRRRCARLGRATFPPASQ